MANNMMSIALALIGLATISVLISSKAKTSNVIQATSAGFANDLVAAMSPVTGAQAQVQTGGGGGYFDGGF